MKRAWLADAFVGLCLSLAVAAAYQQPSLPVIGPGFQTAELDSYDARAKLRTNPDLPEDIRIITVDGPLRPAAAALIERLSSAPPRVIGVEGVFSRPENEQALGELQTLQASYKELVSARKIVDRRGVFDEYFSSACARLDSDARLSEAMRKNGAVVLQLSISWAGPGAKEPLPASVSSAAVTVQAAADSARLASSGDRAVLPAPALLAAAAAAGPAGLEPDFDGVLRRQALVWSYSGANVPSYALQILIAYLGLKPSDAVLVPGKELRLGGASIPLDADSRMLVTFGGPAETFRTYAAADVLSGKTPAETFKDKIVLVGSASPAAGRLFVTPVSRGLPAAEAEANFIENVLRKRFVTRPVWARNAELGSIGLAALLVMFVLPGLRIVWRTALCFLFLLAVGGAGVYLFFTQGQWLMVGYPSALAVLGYLVSLLRGGRPAAQAKPAAPEPASNETNKFLGEALRSHGLLEPAFAKLSQCPVDAAMKDTLYGLAEEFEKKKQFAQGAAVLEHLAKTDPKYKDVEQRIEKLKADAANAPKADEKTLGRYQIEKELGRGAMGVVYLGRDPKINRQVALKTMSFGEAGDAAETKAVKERFFREAESAGTLNHPNIVRIFDAGEAGEMGYIAMELLEGHDFTEYTRKEDLLDPEKAMEYVAKVADALDYAHSKGIVHRDIKPANIMLLNDGTVRVADFGIARITTSSKTATGTVMGTPAYMSPEQVAGKKVDGRSDIFSLSVALYELLCGEKPFKGGDGIGTLLFQIANDPHPDLRLIKPELPEDACVIVDKGLAKDPAQRYQRASDMAADLRRCVEAVKAGTAKPAIPPAVTAAAPQEPAPEPAAAAPSSGLSIVLPPPPPGSVAAEPEPAPEPAPESTAEVTAPEVAPPAAEAPAAQAPAAEATAEATTPEVPAPAPELAPEEATVPEGVSETTMEPPFRLELPAEAPTPVAIEPEAAAPVETLRDLDAAPAGNGDGTMKLALPESEAVLLESVEPAAVEIQLTKPPEASS